MQVEQIPLTELRLDERNARKHNVRNLTAIMASLERFGQQKPIIVDDNNVVRAGNGTLEAARKLGWKELNCVRSQLEGQELAAYAIADNRTSELAEWDVQILVEQLEEFNHLDSDLVAAAGYNDGDLTQLLSDVYGEENDPEREWKNMPEFENSTLSYRALIVHFTAPEHVESFKKLVGQEFSDEAKFIWHPKAEKADTKATRMVDAQDAAE